MSSTTADLEQLRYPIGKWNRPETSDPATLARDIATIAAFPGKLHSATADLSDEQLDTPYRPGGWTVRQVVHHCADSHMNAYVRCKLALTEENPTVKPYFEDRWAELEDGKKLPVGFSLRLLNALHTRWDVLLRSLNGAQLQRSYIHPEHGTEFRLFQVISLYAWHSEHHLRHVTGLKERLGWK
jgi:hypothetical protein